MRRGGVIALVLVLAIAAAGIWFGLSYLGGGQPAHLDFTFSPPDPLVNETVTFTLTSSGGPAPSAVAWSFGDGGAGRGATVTHAYTQAGSFTVNATATTAAGAVTVSHDVIVLASGPSPVSANFTFSPAAPTAGQAITFTATAAGGTPPYTFVWSFGDGAVGSGTAAQHTYAAAGSYAVNLSAADSASHTTMASQTVAVGGSTGSGRITTIVTILMENHAICDILTTCGGAGTYETNLAHEYGLATGYVDCSSPSLPNYLCLSGGQDFGCSGYDGSPDSNGCTAAAWNSTNLVDRLEGAGLTWKAYMEDMPSNCYGADSGNYAVRHDPFVYYSDIVNNPARCALVVPAGTGDAALLGDLNSSAPPNFLWLTPNLCNDMHDCGVATGDAYLSGLVPQILGSHAFSAGRAALFLTFDEDSGGAGSPDVYAVWAGSAAKAGYTSSSAYNHFSFLATIEANWNLPALTANDAAASSMTNFFTTAATATLGSPTPTAPAAGTSGWTMAPGGAASPAAFLAMVVLPAAGDRRGPRFERPKGRRAPSRRSTQEGQSSEDLSRKDSGGVCPAERTRACELGSRHPARGLRSRKRSRGAHLGPCRG